MAEVMTHLKTINSAVRTLLLLGVTGAVGFGGYVGYENYVRPAAEAKQAKADLEAMKAQFEKQTAEMAELTKAKERLETAMKLLKVNQRIAKIEVMDKAVNEDKQPYMEVRFTEVDRNGDVIGSPRDYTILGEKIYVDGWVVTFEDNYVESADELRSASMYVFKSIFGELERPADAKRLDTQSDALPGIYKSKTQNEFEKQIWDNFWKVSGDSKLQKELGIRANHGQANYVIGEKGKVYQVEIRASGAMSLKELGEK